MWSFTYILFAVGLLASHCVATDNISSSPTQSSSQGDATKTASSTTGNEVDLGRHIVWPKDGKNEDALSKTENHIKAVMDVSKVWSGRDFENSLVLWLVFNATDAQVNELQKDDGVLLVQKDWLKKDAAVLPSPTAKARLSSSPPNKAKRALQFATQSNAVSELVMISQPSTVPNLAELDNYVYEPHAGEGIFIYHVEVGIAASKGKNEFPPNQLEFLQTPLSQERKQPPNDDGGEDKNQHSTCTASKTIGQNFGTAKKATLVVVKMADKSASEIALVWSLIWNDIQKKGRQKKSVVTHSIVDANPADRNNLTPDQTADKKGVANLLSNDVIVVYAAGNDATDDQGNPTQRPNVDTSPQIFSGDDFPLIVVGASDLAGAKADFSQGGDAVTVLAGGKSIKCLNRFFNFPSIVSGTSYAAPMVAGVLANFLATDPVPFDMTTGQVAHNARKYLMDHGNWERQPGLKVIWNGVTEADNPKNAAAASSTAPAASSTTPMATSTAPATPTPAFAQKNECHGVSGDFWVESRDIAVSNAANFCQGRSKVYDYNKGTGSELRFSVNYIPDGSKVPTDAPDCVSAFKDAVLDGCDGNDGVNNPHDYKYGGQFSRSDGWVFKMEPLAEHVEDNNCEVSYRFLYDFFEIRGKNFPDAKLGIDGAGLLQQLQGCGGIVDQWYWALTPTDTRFQWYASGRTLAEQKNCIGNAVITAGGVTVGHCHGLG